MKKVFAIVYVLLVGLILSACSPKVGSPEWCTAMDKKDKGEWTTSEIQEYAKDCLFK